MTIKYADVKITETRQRIAALDRELAQIQRQSYSPRQSRQLKQELRKQSTRLGEERCKVWMELVELSELTEMPPEYTGRQRATRWHRHSSPACYRALATIPG